jgi:hypothetical protein
MNMNAAMIAGLARHLLTAVGGIAVSKGWVDNETLVTVAGAVATLIGVAWSLLAKRTPA